MKANKKHKILIVDDDIDIGNTIKMILERNGFNAVFRENPDGIKETMKKNHINLLILDMLLSTINGTEVCEDIKKDPIISGIPVIMISAHPDARKICMDAGADDFISKPFNVDDMLIKINNNIPQGAA